MLIRVQIAFDDDAP